MCRARCVRGGGVRTTAVFDLMMSARPSCRLRVAGALLLVLGSGGLAHSQAAATDSSAAVRCSPGSPSVPLEFVMVREAGDAHAAEHDAWPTWKPVLAWSASRAPSLRGRGPGRLFRRAPDRAGRRRRQLARGASARGPPPGSWNLCSRCFFTRGAGRVPARSDSHDRSTGPRIRVGRRRRTQGLGQDQWLPLCGHRLHGSSGRAHRFSGDLLDVNQGGGAAPVAVPPPSSRSRGDPPRLRRGRSALDAEGRR